MPTTKPLWDKPILKFVVPLLVFLALLTLVIIAVTKSGDLSQSESEQATQQQTFTNYLQPEGELRVGAFRYVSPCQALPVATIEDTFEDFDGEAKTYEYYYDSSVSEEEYSVRTSCEYDIDDESRSIVSLKAEQYTAGDRFITAKNTFLSYEVDDQLVNRYKTAANKSDSEALKKFSNTLSTSTTEYVAPKTEFPANGVNNFDGMLLATTNDDALEIVYKQRNVIYTLEYQQRDGSRSKSIADMSDAEFTTHATRLAKLAAALQANAAKEDLNQSPAPTIIGSSDMLGGVRLLESCDLLDKNALTIMYGTDQRGEIIRSGLPANASELQRQVRDASLVKPVVSSCQRTDGSLDRKAVSLTLLTSNSPENAKKHLDGLFGGTPVSEQQTVQTNADDTRLYTSGGDDLPDYYFQTGPYIGVLSGSDGYGATSEQQVVELINQIVAKVKSRTQ